jgi:hypothetical protein
MADFKQALQAYKVQQEAGEQMIMETMADYVRFLWDPLPRDNKCEVCPAHPEDAHSHDNASTSQN